MNAPYEVSCLYERSHGEYRFETFRCRTRGEAQKVAFCYRSAPPPGYRVSRGPTIKEGNTVVHEYKPRGSTPPSPREPP